MNIQLTPRLKAIAECIKGKSAADIGTDHAYIPLYIVENNICSHVIASDVREGPVNIALANIKRNGAEEKIEVRLGSGLSVLRPGETEDIIIAGMGGELIADILRSSQAAARASRLILQPMNSQYELRHYLLENGYEIIGEDIALEGFKVYNIITAQSGKGIPFERDCEYHLPGYLKNHKNYKALYEKKMRELLRVINGIENSKDPDLEKLYVYKKWYEELKKT